MDNLYCQDTSGKWVEISMYSLPSLYLFGLSSEAINALRNEYIKRNGSFPVTPESVKQVFSEK